MSQNLSILRSRSQIVIFLVTALSLLGLIAFLVMPREEDPRIKRRNAITTVVLPGAAPEKLLRTVVRPIEDKLLTVQELKKVEVEIRPDVAVFQLELRDGVRDIPDAWREVERALDRAAPDIPNSLPVPVLDFSVIDVEALVLAVTGSDDRVLLTDAALRLKDRLARDPDVAEIKLFGEPGLEVLVSVDSPRLHSLGIPIERLLSAVATNNSARSTGFSIISGSRVPLQQDNDAVSVESLKQIRLETGRLITPALESYASVSRVSSTPARALFRWNGKSAIGLGVIPRSGINIVSFGDRFLKEVRESQVEIAPLNVEVVAFQPERTRTRINDLLISLLAGVGLMAAFLGATAGAAFAAIVSVSVPIITLVSLFFYYITGGVLHQISIAAFVISIGQFIDNVVVVIDSIQTRLRNGENPEQAASAVSEELRLPMAYATLTGICAFLPMLSAQGSPADFVFSLPLVAVISLVSSYFVAVWFVPLLGRRLIRPDSRPWLELPFGQLQRLFTSVAEGPPWRIAVLVTAITVASLLSALFIEKEFFPESDRNEFILAVELPPGSDITSTDRVLRTVESYLSKDPRATLVATFAGGGIPRFYYNIPNPRRAPEMGQILISTRSPKDVKPLGLHLEETLAHDYLGIRFTAQFLQQGPPINAKVELNFFSEEPSRREELNQRLSEIITQEPGVRSVRPDDQKGMQRFSFVSRDEALANLGLDRNNLNSILAFYSSGVTVSEFRRDREIIPVVVRDRSGLTRSLDDTLKQIAIRGRDHDFKVGELVKASVELESSILRRKNGQTFTRLRADLQPEHTFDRVLKKIRPKLDGIKLKNKERIEFGGDAQGSAEANASILKVVPTAMTLLILFLLLQFRSYRKVMIVALAIPVTIMGVFPGLWLSGQPFGFMSLLGVLALVGIAVNNIILLLEAVETEGSVGAAVRTRFRAIFLTTLLTLLGLIPLALEDSPLWPPLAWTMISGLITGTIATLIVVPGLYRVFFRTSATEIAARAPMLLTFVISVVGALSPSHQAYAEEPIRLTIAQVGDRADSSDEQAIVNLEVEEAEVANRLNWRATYLPRLIAGADFYRRDRELRTPTPFGLLPFESQGRLDAQIELRQPIFNAEQMLAGRGQSATAARAARRIGEHQSQELRFRWMTRALETLILERELKFLLETIENLRGRRRDMETLIRKGRTSRTDLIRIDLSIERFEHEAAQAKNAREVALQQLASELGIDGSLELIPPVGTVRPVTRDIQPTAQIDSLRLRVVELDESIRRLRLSAFPTVDTFARVVQTNGRNLVETRWLEAGLGLRWEIYAGGTRSAEERQLATRRATLERRIEILQRDHQNEILKQRLFIEESLRRQERLDKLQSRARENRAAESQRYREGRSSVNDLVEADSAEIETRKDLDLVNLKLRIACMQIELSSGRAVSPDCDGKGP